MIVIHTSDTAYCSVFDRCNKMQYHVGLQQPKVNKTEMVRQFSFMVSIETGSWCRLVSFCEIGLNKNIENSQSLFSLSIAC